MRSRNKGEKKREHAAPSPKRAATAKEVPKGSDTDSHALQRVPLRFPRDKYVLLAGSLVAAVLFSNGFSDEMVFDDGLAISRNKDAATNQGVSLVDIFFHDFWGHRLDEVASNGSYRPLTILTFRLQYMLAGLRHNGRFLHLFNFAVAYLNTCLVYYLARLYHQMIQLRSTASADGEPGKKRSGNRHWGVTSEPYAVPTVAMLLYLVHPVHVDAVTSIVGRCELLYCLFGLLAFFAMHTYATADTGRKHGEKPMRAQSVLDRAVARLEDSPKALLGTVVGMMVCCLLCKDSGITFTAIFILHAVLLYVWDFTSRRRLAVMVAVSVGMTVAYFTFRRAFIGELDLSKSRLLRRTENPQYFIPEGAWHWLSMRWTIQVKNLELLFYPTKLCCEYSYNCIPHMENIHDSRFPYYVTVSTILLVVLLALAYCGFVRGSRLAVLLLLFVMWIAIPYAPVSHLFVHVGTFIAERCLYVPSIGVALIYAFALQPAFVAITERSSVFVVGNGLKLLLLLTLAGVWFAISHQRNLAWLSNEALFREAIKVCPNSGKSHAQLAIAVSSRENQLSPESIALFTRALQLDSEDMGPLYYLAIDQWQNKHNARVAYDMIRACVGSPFSVTQCHPLYIEMRRALYPNMTAVEVLLDEALIAPLASQRAQRFREAGLIQYSQGSGDDPCAGLTSMKNAIYRWNESGLYWSSDESHPLYDSVCFCNTAYWWAEIFDNCFLQPKVPDAEKAIVRVDDDGEEVAVVKPRRLRHAMRDMRMVAANCMTDWAAPGVVRGAGRKLILTYANRLRDFVTLMNRLKITMAHLKPFLLREEERRLAKLTALQLALSEYCGVVTLVENADVKRAVAAEFLGEVANLDAVVAASQGHWRLEMAGLWREVRLMAGEGEEERETIIRLKSEIRAMAQCSPGLAPIFT